MVNRIAYNALIVCWLLVPTSAIAQCLLDGDEYLNPFDPSCGGQILTYVESSGGGNRVALGYPVPIPVDTLDGVDGFRTYATLHARHQDLMMMHSEVEGNVVGRTLGGREIWAYRIGDADLITARDATPEPAVMVNGGIHANEWQTPEVLTEIFEQLVEMKDDGGLGQYLAENLNVVLLPVQNIDGFIQTQRFPTTSTADRRLPNDGRMRRKNLRATDGTDTLIDSDLNTSEDNFFGVDLNRNNAQGYGLGGSTNPTARRYRGPLSASEPETQALLAAAELAPGNRLRLFMDFHSFGQFYYGQETNNSRLTGITTALAERMRAVTGLKYGWQMCPNDQGYGMTNQLFSYMLEVPAWGVEVEPNNGGQDYGGTGAPRSGFILPDREIARVRDELAQTSLLGFYRQTGPPAIEAARISHEQSGETMFDARWLPASNGTRSLNVMVNKALTPGTKYRLWVAFDKPMRWRNRDGVITNFDGQRVTDFPTIMLQAAGLPGNDIEVVQDGKWLNTPGGAPGGYMRYADDALTVNFTIPVDFPATDPEPLILSVSAQDLSQSNLDGNPATPVDFASGHWIGYENFKGDSGDIGGADCTLRLFAAADASAAPPLNDQNCNPPAKPSSGGGHIGWFLLALLLCVSVSKSTYYSTRYIFRIVASRPNWRQSIKSI